MSKKKPAQGGQKISKRSAFGERKNILTSKNWNGKNVTFGNKMAAEILFNHAWSSIRNFGEKWRRLAASLSYKQRPLKFPQHPETIKLLLLLQAMIAGTLVHVVSSSSADECFGGSGHFRRYRD